jgi:hypothetical protein
MCAEIEGDAAREIVSPQDDPAHWLFIKELFCSDLYMLLPDDSISFTWIIIVAPTTPALRATPPRAGGE